MEAPLDALLRGYVTPGLRAARWKKARGTYTWQADNGDRAIITFQRSAHTRSDLSIFFINVGILPFPAAQMQEYYVPLPKVPQAWHGAYYGRVRPGRAGYEDVGGEWRLREEDVPSMGSVLSALVADEVAPMLIRSLDRDVLLGRVAGRGFKAVDWMRWGRGGLCLIADTGPSAEIDAQIERMRADVPHMFMYWADNVNWLIAGFSYLADRYPDRYGNLRPEIEQLKAEFARQYASVHGYDIQGS